MSLNWSEVETGQYVARGQRYAYTISWRAIDDFEQGPAVPFLEVTTLDTNERVAARPRPTEDNRFNMPPYMHIGSTVDELKARAENIDRIGLDQFTYEWIDQKRPK